MVQIEKIEKLKSDLKIKWTDGEESAFNYMWLRDNCPTAHDKDSRHRMFNILNVSDNLNIKKIAIRGTENWENNFPYTLESDDWKKIQMEGLRRGYESRSMR